jgi:hypothetical protein
VQKRLALTLLCNIGDRSVISTSFSC